MNLYAEPSAVLRWLLGGPGGDDARLLLGRAEAVFASRLTILETHRALVRATTQAEITEAQALEAAADLATASACWTLVEILPQIAERAGQRFPSEPIRSLDAIHLATALFLSPDVGPLSMLSTDGRILKNAPLLGLRIALPA